MRAVCAAILMMGTSVTASANDGFSRVIPGRPGVPVIIDGVDASYAVVESDWGLAKNVHMQPTVYGGRPVRLRRIGHYYPSAGRMPGYGRLEKEPPPNRRLPPQAESYRRSWSVESAPPAPAPVPAYPPVVIEAPHDLGPQGPHTPPHRPDPHS